MALTPEEKARNKETRKARDRAYHERYRLRQKAERAGLEEIDREFQEKIETAEAAERAAEAARTAALDELDKQILALQEKRKQVQDQHNALCSAAREPARQVWNAKNDAKSALDKKLDEAFPDLTGHARWSAAAWGHRTNFSAKE